MFKALKLKVDLVTWPCPFRGQFVARPLDCRPTLDLTATPVTVLMCFFAPESRLCTDTIV